MAWYNPYDWVKGSEAVKQARKGNYRAAAINTVYNLSGARDIADAKREFQKDNYLGAAGDLATGLTFLIPGVGAVGRTALKVGSHVGTKATKIAFKEAAEKASQTRVEKALTKELYLKNSKKPITTLVPKTAQTVVPLTSMAVQTVAGSLAPEPASPYAKYTKAYGQYPVAPAAKKPPLAQATKRPTVPGTKAPMKYFTQTFTPNVTTGEPQVTTEDTTNTINGKVIPKPGTVSTSGATAANPVMDAALAQYGASLSKLASKGAMAQQNIFDRGFTGLQSAYGTAADIYGGRAPAILGQAVQGVNREMITGLGKQAIQNVEDQGTLASSYDEAVRKAYSGEAQKALDLQEKRIQNVSQIKKIGGI